MTTFNYFDDIREKGFLPLPARTTERLAYVARRDDPDGPSVWGAALEGGAGVTLVEAWRQLGRPVRFWLGGGNGGFEVEYNHLSEMDALAIGERMSATEEECSP